MSNLDQQLASLLGHAPDRASALREALRLVLAHFQSETGTIHCLDHERQLLHLAAESGLPPSLLEAVRTIPVGKGIAGQTVARGEPVTLCNLQADKTGVSQPGARTTGLGGALCVPLRKDNKIVGTIGVGTLRQYQYTSDETRQLENIGRKLGEFLEKAEG